MFIIILFQQIKPIGLKFNTEDFSYDVPIILSSYEDVKILRKTFIRYLL